MKMRWGGKLFFGLIGYLIGGITGAVIGGLIGHFFDSVAMKMMAYNPFMPYQPGEQEQMRSVLLDTAFAIMGHLAKADGRVSEEEIAQAEVLMTRMQLDTAQRQQAIRQFQRGKDENFPLEQVVGEFRHATRYRKHMILMFLEMLLQTALADGVLHPSEEKVLMRVAQGLGVPEAQFRQVLAMLLAQARFSAGTGSAGAGQGYHSAGAAPRADSVQQAYQVLGLQPGASDAEVKRAYRKLMSEHHPDKLAAKGVPEEMIRVATERSAEITTAYDLIKKSRNL